MSKKIKALVQKYEKDMQFENRFDELKHKLDLIPDAEVKSEVFTIKRKVMPAYVMMVVLLMLVTGIIGLQFGLNSDFVEGPTTVDNVEFRLMELVDTYDREAASILFIEENARLNVYVGYLDNQKVIVLSGQSKLDDDIIIVNYDDTEYTITISSNYVVIQLVDESNIELDVDIYNTGTLRVTKNFVLNLTINFEYIGR